MIPQTYYLGIDVSKGYSDFVILDKNRRVVQNRILLYDTFDGHSELYSLLQAFCSSHRVEMIYCGVESTGGYENNWYAKLKDFSLTLPLQVARINPLGVHHSSKADLKRVITDSISAHSIAEYLINHSNKVVFDVDDSFSDFKKQITHIRLLKSQKVQLLNQLESLVYTSFPEILGYCKNGAPQWVLNLLEKYPTAKKVSRAKHYTLSKIPNISSDKSKTLIELASKSVASSFSHTTELLIISIVKQIKGLERVIKSHLDILDKTCQSPDYELLKSFPGIGKWSAIVLLIEIGNIERFPSAKRLASYFGLNPKFKQSGDGMSKPMMSKQGRVEPRRVLYMVAMVGIQNNPILKKVYEKHTAQGMRGAAAIGVCMHKALRIVYGMLKNNTTFNPQVDEDNQSRSYVKPLENGTMIDKEVLINSVVNAPISGRRYKEIKAEAVHQNE